jgi:dTDP-4-dehydrorhamnose 3,5-epimerase
MKIIATELPEVLLIEPRVFGDARGWFCETWQRERYAEAGIDGDFVQDNQSFSGRGTLRGLHIQNPFGQGKLVQVITGEVFDVAVDVRRGSPHFGRWAGAHLSSENKHQFWVPKGFLHGFPGAQRHRPVQLQVHRPVSPGNPVRGALGRPGHRHQWPDAGGQPLLSDKDRNAPLLRDIPDSQLPEYPN